MQSIASLVLESTVPGVKRLGDAMRMYSDPGAIQLEYCNILGGHAAWVRFLRTGELSLLNTKRMADFIGRPMSELMPESTK